MAQQNNIRVGLEIKAGVSGENEIKQLSQTLNSTATATDHLGKEAKTLSERLVEARAEATRLKTAWAQDKGNEEARMAYVRQGKAVQQLQRELASLATNGSRSHAQLAQAAAQHGQKLKQLEQSLQNVTPSINGMMGAFAGLVSSNGGLAYVANEAIKFESAMARVKKVTDATPKQIATLSAQLKDLGGSLGMMPDELAQIAAAGGQMGIAFDKLPEFTKMTAQMSNAFNMTADAAGDMSAKISNVYGLTIDEMRELGDAINTLGNNTAAKEAEIGNVLMRIGGNAKQFKLAKEEAAALSAAFVSLGKSPEEAGTAINALLTKLQTATEQSGEFKSELKNIGLSAQEMAANIRANPQAALTDFLKRIEKLDEQSRSITLSKMFGAEYSDDLALLVGGLETYEKALKKATDRTETFGAMQKEASAALETTEGKMKQAKADIAAAAIDLGNALLPAVQATASVLGSVADAVQSISAQFPVLTQIAVLFAGAKIAAMTAGAAMKMAGLDGQMAFLKTERSVQGVKKSLIETAATAKIFGRDLKNALAGNTAMLSTQTGAVANLGKGLASLAANALSLWAAFEGGWAVGTMLREQFAFVRDLGDLLGKGVAYLDAIVTDRTFEDVAKFYRTEREELKEQEKAQREAAKAKQERANAEKKANEERQASLNNLRSEYEQIQKQYDNVTQAMKNMADEGKAGSKAYQDLAAQQAELSGKLMQSQLSLNQLGQEMGDTAPAAKMEQALKDLGLSAETMSTGISKGAREAIDNFALAAQSVGNDAIDMATVFQAAAAKMDSPEALAELKKSLLETGEKAGLTVEQLNRIAATAPQAGLALGAVSKPLGEAEKAAEALGISLESAFTHTSPAMQASLAHFATIKEQLGDLARHGVDTGIVLRDSLNKLTENAQTESDILKLKAEIEALGKSGKLAMQDVERAILAADQKLNQLRASTDPTIAAFDKLGIKTKEAARLSAEEMRLAFETVQKSGQASAQDLMSAFEQTANAMLATGDAQQRKWVENQAAAYQYTIAVDATGKAAVQSALQTAMAAQKQVQAHNQVAEAAKASAEAQSQASAQAVADTEKATASAENHGRKLSELGQKVHYSLKQTGAYANLGTASWVNIIKYWQNSYIEINRIVKSLNEEVERGGNISENLIKAQKMARNGIKTLDKATLNNLHDAIDKAKKKMAELSEEAKNARKEAEKSLLSAQGKDDELAKLEQQEKLDALRKKQSAAKRTGNTEAVADYEAAIKAQEKAYAEQARREQQQREQERLEQERLAREQAQEQARQRQTLSTPSSVNLNLDANEMADILQARDENVANQALNNLMKQMQDASYRSR